MSAVTGPKLAPKTQAPQQGKGDSKKGNGSQQPKVPLTLNRHLPETYYNRPNPLPKKEPMTPPDQPAEQTAAAKDK